MLQPKSLIPTILLSLGILPILCQMEQSGIRIQEDRLKKLEDQLDQKLKELEPKLHRLAQDALGDTPFNLNSLDDLSELIYSRHVNDKRMWAQVFQLGAEVRGSVKKARKPRRLTPVQFRRAVKLLTTPIYKTRAEHCDDCGGTGHIRKTKRDGTPFKHLSLCQSCQGNGMVYTVLAAPAGFLCTPNNSTLCRSNGFATDTDTLQDLIKQEGITDEARTFITALVEYRETNKHKTFTDGLRRAIRPDGFIHCSFMQTVTATGRLSSQTPNFHNQPRGSTFPIREVVTSRWEGGCITDADYAQLEFRVAAQLSECGHANAAILKGVDVHSDTARIITDSGQSTDRQAAKAHTFKPLYGGTSGTRAERSYYTAFLEQLYPGIGKWHQELLGFVVENGYIQLPSGRAYKFPRVRRFPSGGVSGATQIKNYPVQGFATADIVPLATLYVSLGYHQASLRSVLINEVHDSIVTDTYPGEEDIVAKINKQVMEGVKEQIQEWFGYDFTVPLKAEVKQGPDWLNVRTVL